MGAHAAREIQQADILLTRAGTGDQKAFAEFYDLTKSRIFAVIKRCLLDWAQSEEVTQDVYLEIWRTASRYDSSTSGALTWSITMAHRRAIDRVRASQASRTRDHAVGIRDFETPYDNVAETVEVKTEHERALRALSNITEIQREVIALAYFDGLSQSEIAERLQVNLGTVKTRMRDGLIRLRVEMALTA